MAPRPRSIVVLVCLLAGAVGACNTGTRTSGTSPSAETTTTAETAPANVEIESSLEGVAVLPRHVRWTATTSLPDHLVLEVRFLVDGSLWWSDDDPPYAYGEGAYLAAGTQYDPYYDKPGRKGHRFTVRVLATDGASSHETVRARVEKIETSRRAPHFGIWGRLPPAAVTDPRPPNQIGPYTADLRLLDSILWVGRTYKRAFAYEVSADERRFYIGVPMSFGSEDRTGNQSGWLFKGYQCAPDGPPATYTWSWTRPGFDGPNPYKSYILLEAEHEPCSRRRRTLQGVWQLVD